VPLRVGQGGAQGADAGAARKLGLLDLGIQADVVRGVVPPHQGAVLPSLSPSPPPSLADDCPPPPHPPPPPLQLVKKGALPSISISSERRQGNKRVTRITGALHPPAPASTRQHPPAPASTCSRHPRRTAAPPRLQAARPRPLPLLQEWTPS
jgi:hypothetical protein